MLLQYDPRKNTQASSTTRVSDIGLLREWCCGENSLLGKPSVFSKGCSVVRLTQREYMTTHHGVHFAKASVERAPPDVLVVIWTALPCTGGSPWQNINKHLPGGMDRLNEH